MLLYPVEVSVVLIQASSVKESAAVKSKEESSDKLLPYKYIGRHFSYRDDINNGGGRKAIQGRAQQMEAGP